MKQKNSLENRNIIIEFLYLNEQHGYRKEVLSNNNSKKLLWKSDHLFKSYVWIYLKNKYTNDLYTNSFNSIKLVLFDVYTYIRSCVLNLNNSFMNCRQ